MAQNKNITYYRSYSPHRQTVSSERPRRIRRRWIVAVMLPLLVMGLWHLSIIKKLGTHELVAAHAAPKIDAHNYTVMDQTINTVISEHNGVDIGVAFIDLNSSTVKHYGVSDPFVAASTIKTLTAIYFLHQAEQGKASLTQLIGGKTAKDQLQQMIEESDNDAWESLNAFLGHPGLEAYAQSDGLHSYNAEGNLITPDDVALLLQKLFTHKLLNDDHTNLLLSYLHQANEADYIVPVVPNTVQVYHKAGLLDDRIHDSAIIDNGTDPYVLVIFTNGHGTYNTGDRTTILQTITKATLP